MNDQVGAGDAFLEGIPYPGVYVTDEEGIVVAKFFHDTYKVRDSPEMLIDAALGRLEISDQEPSFRGGDEEVRISVFVHGGRGSIRQGIRRQLIVRFDLGPGMHLYGEPVPDGMVPTKIEIEAPPGLVLEAPIYPPTETLRLTNMDVDLHVWTGAVDIVVPFYATGILVSETRPLDETTIELEVNIRYQACDDDTCLLPKTEKVVLSIDLDVIDVPALGPHLGHGQREANFRGAPHMTRLIQRKLRKHPLGLARYLLKSIRLELAAKWRSVTGK